MLFETNLGNVCKGTCVTSLADMFCLFPLALSRKQNNARGDVVLNTTGVTCASVIIPAGFMESAVRTLYLSAPRVRLSSPDKHHGFRPVPLNVPLVITRKLHQSNVTSTV